MTRIKKFFGACEKEVYQGLLKSCDEDNIDTFAKVRISDIVNLTNSGLDDEEFDFATRAHFDFVLCRNNVPLLAIEFDFLEIDGNRRWQAQLKDQICAKLDVPFLRVDATRLDLSSIRLVTQELIESWKAGGVYADSPVINGCCLHSKCDLSTCHDFQTIGAWLFAFHDVAESMDEIEPFSTTVTIQIEEKRDGYVQCNVALQSGKLKLRVGQGRCFCSMQLRDFSKQASVQLALWHASKMIQDAGRGFHLGTDPFVLAEPPRCLGSSFALPVSST